LAGTLRTTASQSAMEFDGTMELLAAVERICTADEAPETP
jgi:hypothetical protein